MKAADLWKARAEVLLPIADLAYKVWMSHKIFPSHIGGMAAVSDEALTELGAALEQIKAESEREATPPDTEGGR